jgi:hypothetical protein
MQDMKKTKQQPVGNEDSKKKERHIVTWTQEVPFFSLSLHAQYSSFLKSLADVI